MNKQTLSVIAFILAALITTWSVVRFLKRPPVETPLEPAVVLQERIESAQPLEVRVEAARRLARHGVQARQEIRQVFQTARAQEETEVLLPIMTAIGESREWKEIPSLVELMRHPDIRVRGRAGAIAQRLIGADYGFRAELPEAESNAVIAKIEEALPVMQPRLQEFYGNDE